MNIATHVTLSVLPNYDESHAVTVHSDGTVLSRVFDLEWDFSGQEQGAILSSPLVIFKSIDASYRRDIQLTLAAVMQAYEVRHDGVASKEQVNAWKYGLTHVRGALGSSDWTRLSDDRVYKKFKVKLKKKVQALGWSESTVSEIVRAINKLNESTLCARKPDGKEFLGWVDKESEQHIAVPIGIYQPLLANALHVVETYHPHRHAINDVQAKLEKIYAQESKRTDATLTVSAVSLRVLRRSKALSHSIPNFKLVRDGRELNRLQTACAIVVTAFSGVRVGELVSMNKDSYKEVGGSRIPVLRGEETKRNGQAIYETWQTHKVAKEALELAYDMTQFLRSIYEETNNNNLDKGKITGEAHQRYSKQIASAFLSVKPIMVSSNYCQSNMSQRFNTFMKNSGVVATQADVDEFNRLNPVRYGQLKVGGTLPKLTPHDFRRNFAVFFKRYGFGSSATIKFQYKHSNLQMSDYYANNASLQAMEDILMDHDLLKIMKEEGIQMGVDIFDDIYNKSETLSGSGGERIAKDKFEQLQGGHKVYMSREEIESLVRSGTLSVVKLPTGGYCMNATCSRVCGIGQFAGEIKPCEHQVVTDKEAKVILRQNKRLIQSFRDMNTGDPMMNSILVGMKQKILRNELIIKKHNLRFEEFYDAVKGVMDVKEV